jgi:uncharacterized protein (DUF1684 family)
MTRRLKNRGRWLMWFVLTSAISFTVGGLLDSRMAAAQDAPQVNPSASPASADDAAWLQELTAWRAQREREIDAPDGWLTLAGLEWLKPGINSVGAQGDNQIQLHFHAPAHLGVLAVSENEVELQAPADGFPPDLLIDGEVAQNGQLVAAGEKPSTITWQALTLVVLRRGGRYMLRIKDANSRTRTAFHGLNWYAPDPHFRVVARWIPYTTPRTEKIPTVIGTTLELPSPGVAEFTLDGKTMRLEPVIEDPTRKKLFFILRDQTRYDTTYEAARYLNTGLPDHGLDKPGLLTLDFNRLENPPCAYTPYATCPLPPVSNRLLVQLQAGEKRYER